MLASALFWDLLTTPLTKARLSPRERPTMACITVTRTHLTPLIMMMMITGGWWCHMFLVSLVTFYCVQFCHFWMFYTRRSRDFAFRLLSTRRSNLARAVQCPNFALLSRSSDQNWFSETRAIVKWRSTEMIMMDFEHDFYGFTAAAKTAIRRLFNTV